MIKKIHHINFIVNDLSRAIDRYRTLFGEPYAGIEKLEQRGVLLARFKVGDTWLVLVQPVNGDGAPAQLLKDRGEGFFLMSCQVDDVKEAAGEIARSGISVADLHPRQGLDDWRVVDLDPIFGAQFQLVESSQ
jgi:methylmalonyl-CoA/ethylmalonyl-CoA epimerase